MLSTKLKADIRKLWDAFWSGGLSNPLTAIEQITYLVFLKRLQDLDDERARVARDNHRPYTSIFENAADCRWSHIKQLPGEERLRHMQTRVFDWLKQIDRDKDQDRMRDAVFVIPNANLLQRAIDILGDLFVPSRNQDTLGDIYEYLLSEIAEAGKNGQFRTPRHIIRMMIDLVDPQLGERIADPACGTGGFLVNTYQHILKTHTSPDMLKFEADGSPLDAYGDLLSTEQHEALRRNHLYGWDFDRTMVRLGWMNMIQHGLEEPQINYADTLGSRFHEQIASGKIGDFDVLLANPPFTGNIDKSDIGESLSGLGTTKTELLFVELFLQLLRVGGRAAIIVPEGVLFGSTKAHLALRKKLVTENELKAIISLPGGVFQPYTGVKTSVLCFSKGGKTENVWFYEVADDGMSLNARRTDRPEKNDLWDLTVKYRLRYRTLFKQSAPAFVSGDAWAEWEKLDLDTVRQSYFQPVFRVEQRVDDEGETVKLDVLDHAERQPDTFVEATPQDWDASISEVEANDWNLSAGRYKPFTLAAAIHEKPADLIHQALDLETQIAVGLQNLLASVEGKE